MLRSRLSIVLSLLAVVLLVVLMASCSTVFKSRGRKLAARETETAIAEQHMAAAVTATLTQTPFPTASPTRTATYTPTQRPTATLPPSATPQPTATVGELPTATAAGLPIVLPAEGPFQFTLLQEDVNDYLAGQALADQGVTVRDARLVFAEGEVLAEGQASHADSGVTVGVSLRGVFSVVDGGLYVRIEDLELDKSVPSFTRLIATALIEQLLKQYETPDGIPVPLQGVELQRVDITPGKLYVAGTVGEGE